MFDDDEFSQAQEPLAQDLPGQVLQLSVLCGGGGGSSMMMMMYILG